MGGNRYKRVNWSLWNRLWSIPNSFLDLLSGGYISRLEKYLADSAERERTLSGRVVSLASAYDKEKRIWEKRIRIVEATNERLEGKVAEAEGALALAQEELARVKQGIIYYWPNAHQQFQEALAGLQEFYATAGMEIDEETLAKSVGLTMQRLKMATKEAGARVADMQREVQESREKNVLADALIELDTGKPLLVIGVNNVIEAANETAQRLFDRRFVGEYADSLYDGLSAMIGYVAETYEKGFDLNLRNRIARVRLRRVRNAGEYIGGAVVTFEQKEGWLGDLLHRKRDEIREAVNKAVILNDVGMPFIINLTRLREVPKDTGRRLYGLSKSNYFRQRLTVRVGNAGVYTELEERYGVPLEMMDYTGESKASTERGPEGTVAPERA